MRLSSTIDVLLSRIQSAQTEQIQLITQLLGLKIGDEFFAQAQKITQPTEDERKQLLDLINAKLVLLNKNSAAPAVQDQIKQFNELLKLLQNPLLKFLDLKIFSIKGEQRLLTYTDQPIATNQELVLKINQKQQVELVSIKANTNTRKDIIISENLRQLLPRQNTAINLLVYLPKLLQVIQKLPLVDRKELISSNLQNALHKVANQIPTASQLIRPEAVKAVIKNSGLLFERQLALELKPGLTKELKPNIDRTLDKIVERDSKGALLHLLAQLEKELPKIQSTQTTQINNLLAKGTVTSDMDLLQWLTELGQKLQSESSGPQLNIKHLRNQLMLLLHQYTLSSLTKIQLQQIHALSNKTETKDSTQTAQSWQLEIPVRQGLETQQVQMKIDQYWVDDNEETTNKIKNKERQWHILLSFNLAHAGQFDAQLILLKNQLSARFWADKPSTLHLVKAKMDAVKTQLEKEGLKVVQLECALGKSPQPKMTLSYSLVDIKT